jgi:hypothetical protein
MTTFTITDNFTKEIVATRKTENAAKKWAKGLNQGLALFNGEHGMQFRYSVSKVEAK